jgi:hypothetical protein
VDATEAIARAKILEKWRRFRVARLRTLIIGGVAWVAQLVAALVTGDNPLSGAVDDAYTSGRPKRKKIISTNVDIQVPASLVLARLKGWPAQVEQDVARRWGVRVRGAAATVAGLLAVTASEMHWNPNSTWRSLGAREWLVKRSDVHHLEVLPVGAGCGMTLSLKDGSEIWLWVAARGSFPLVSEHLATWR